MKHLFKSNTLNRRYPHSPSQPTALGNIGRDWFLRSCYSPLFLLSLSCCYLDAMRYCFGIGMNKGPLAQPHLSYIKNAPSFLSLPIAEFLICPKSIL